MIKPIDDIVIIEAEKGYQGLIQVAGHQEHVGRVLAVGPGKWRKAADGSMFRSPVDVQPGDRVLFSHRAGMDEKVDGKPVLVMREGDIMGVLDEDADVGLTESRKAWGL